jgi:hypothetical protein
LFEVLPGISDENGITDRAFEGDDDDVSELSLPESCMQDFSIECVLELEPEGVQPSINLMAAAMEMPATMEIYEVMMCGFAIPLQAIIFPRARMVHIIAARR